MRTNGYIEEKKSLPSIKLSEYIHSKKYNQYVIGKTIKLSNKINFHRKLTYFNQRRIIKENNKQITKFKSCFENSNMKDVTTVKNKGLNRIDNRDKLDKWKM